MFEEIRYTRTQKGVGMKIVIVGDGKVGYTLAKNLSQEGHDIVVIDNDPEVLRESQEVLDVMVVNGNGATLETQRAADVGSSDLLIAATSGDEINLLCCVLARKLGCRNTIARVRNPEYTQQISFLREELGLSMTINPEKAAAREIYRLLQLPSFLKRDSFARGRVELVELKLREGNPLCGVRLDKLEDAIGMKILVCTVERDGEITIPTGNFQLELGDKITITAPTKALGALIKGLGITQQKVHNVMLIGGSRIAAYLAKNLLESRIKVKIIEEKRGRCEELADALPGALIIHGDGSSQELLLAEGIEQMDAVVTLTGFDEENLFISMYADYMGVPKCITKINRMEYAHLMKSIGLETLMSPKSLTANEILQYVRAMGNTSGGSVVTLHRIVDGKAEALEFEVKKGISCLNMTLAQINLKKDILITCINRGNQIILPRGSDCLREGDSVIIVTTADHAISDLNDIFADGRPGKDAGV